MNASTGLRAVAVAAACFALSACTALVGLNNNLNGDGDGPGDGDGDIIGDGDGDIIGDGDGDGPGDGDGDGDVIPQRPVIPEGLSCDDVPAASSLTELIDRFSANIYPMMTRDAAEGGCITCHGPDVVGGFAMGTTAVDTFHKIRTAGYFDFDPLNFYDRVDRALMPPSPNPAWNDDERDDLRVFTCAAVLYEQDNPIPLDEIFPPGLLEPYVGPAPTEYDNTFLTFEQLKGRIDVQFGDDWVRDGEDRFSANISLFGGVDFENAYIPARAATAEFLVGLDLLAEDVCSQAAAQKTGPFDGLDFSGPLQDTAPQSTTLYEPADLISVTGQGTVRATPWNIGGNPPSLRVVSAGGGRAEHTFPSDGDYEITISAQGDEAGPDLPHMQLLIDGVIAGEWDVPESTGFADYDVTITTTAGLHTVDAMFTNDYYMPDDPDPNNRDRNLFIQRLQVVGPVNPPVGGDTAMADTLAKLGTVFERVTLRPGDPDADLMPLYNLLVSLDSFDGDRDGAYAGVCEGLIRHPDFLFTRPAAFDGASADERSRMLVIKSALDLLDRPPTQGELDRFDTGESTRQELVDEWLDSDDFRDAFYHRARILLETDGTVDGDEPARMLTHIFLADRPMRDLLAGEYGVDENFEPQARPPEHGATGVLTMKGYIKGKPGLPHYNYSARVMTGFMGRVFEVPPEVFDERDTATAASTVDPESICYSCHQVLTPLAHQRLKWDDDGNYREVDDMGMPLDDSDHGLVDGYPYAGNGMEAFSQVAIRKEGFIRRMINTQFQMVFNRQMRHQDDERTLYFDLWQAAGQGEGTFRDVLEAVLFSDAYVNPIGTN